VTRIEAFSDAVLAIAITLLVVELPFDKVRHGDLAAALGDHWSTFVAYALSFGGIAIMWLNHHAIFTAVQRVDRPLILLNLVMLFGAAFLPFPTALVGDYLPDGGADARLAVVLYSGTWTVVSAAAALMCRHALRDTQLYRTLGGATIAYAAFTLLALVSPAATIAAYIAAAVYFLARGDLRALSAGAEDPGASPRRA